MHVTNIHSRKINASKTEVLKLFATLASKEDQMWPKKNWPRMKLSHGLTPGSAGGHGPIKYVVTSYDPIGHITFQFQKPPGFNGTHTFEIESIKQDFTQIKHTIDMHTSGFGTIKWLVAVKWLHNALIEDAYDQIESRFRDAPVETEWNWWVKLLRFVLS